jgi:DNA invertase Pin-like site-specific DNA recombinase
VTEPRPGGANKGRKLSLTRDQAVGLRQRALEGQKKSLLAREFGVSRETVYAYLRSPDS